MSLVQADPPFRHISKQESVSASSALSRIAQYLENSENDEYAYLHPDCTFDHRGPTRTAHATSRGLVLHQLWRIKEGLEGKNLGEEAVLDDFAGNGQTETTEQAEAPGAEANYQEQQRQVEGNNDEVGEVGERHNAVGEVDEIPIVESSKKRKRKVDENDAQVLHAQNGSKKTKKAKKSEQQTDHEVGSADPINDDEESSQPVKTSSGSREETKEERRARKKAEKSAKTDGHTRENGTAESKEKKKRKKERDPL